MTAVAVLLAALSSPLHAQYYMYDSSSTYVDSWAGSADVYGFGSTVGAESLHDYAVDVEVRSLANRTSSAIGRFGFGYVENTAVLSWAPWDLGEYAIATTHRGWCNFFYVAFVFTQNVVFGGVNANVTIWTDPWPAPPPFGPSLCIYYAHACLPGTSPTCDGWLAANMDPQPCSAFLRVHYVSYTRLFTRYCFPIGLGTAAGGAGACT